MNTIVKASLVACIALGAGIASAQDTSRASTKMDAKKDMSMQDCKDHMNTMKGQKRSDPATADTTAKCETMMKDGMKSDGMKGGGKMGTDGTKTNGGSSMGSGSGTPSTGTGTTSGTSSGATGTGSTTPTK